MKFVACVAVIMFSIGVPLSALLLEVDPCMVDVVFCVDNSGSIGSENWPLVLDAVKNFVRKLNVGPFGSHVGLVDFGDRGYLKFDLASYTSEDDIISAIDELTYKGEETYMSYGLEESHRILGKSARGFRAGIPKLIVLITDGIPSEGNLEDTKDQVDLIKADNIRIISVGVGSNTDVAFLESVASSETDYAFAEDFEALATIADSAVNADTCKPLPTTSVEEQECPPEFDYSSSPALCYKIVTELNTHIGSDEACEELHPSARLVAIKNIREQKVLNDSINALSQEELVSCKSRGFTEFHIGGQRQIVDDCSSPFVWNSDESESEVGDVIWAAGEPNCLAGNENCLAIWSERQNALNDIPCVLTFCSICQIPLL